MSSLPGNVHVSTHPCLRAKLSQLRSSSTQAREVKALVHEIALIVGCEALAAGLTAEQGPSVGILIRPFVDLKKRLTYNQREQLLWVWNTILQPSVPKASRSSQSFDLD